MVDPVFSVFTPTHGSPWLRETFESLVAQDFPDWQWIVARNNGACSSNPPEWLVDDPRIRLVDLGDVKGVGAAKKAAVEACTGRYLVELDHDDLLEEDALSEVYRAFQGHPDASLVYSRFAEIRADGSPHDRRFYHSHGWEYDEGADGSLIARPMESSPHNVSLIWYAPNHVRAFTREAYDQAGGYDADLEVLDDQDLMSRLYRVGPFVAVDKLLYRQRLHGQNTHKDSKFNAQIQARTWDLYERDVLANAEAWAWRKGLLVLKSPQLTVRDLNELRRLPDNSVGVLQAVDLLQHVTDPENVMYHLHRVIAPNGMLLSLTPSTDGRGAYAHPVAKSYWNEFTFYSYLHEGNDAHPKFQASRLRTFYPTDWHKEQQVSYVQANLMPIKPGSTRDGGLLYVRSGALVDRN